MCVQYAVHVEGKKIIIIQTLHRNTLIAHLHGWRKKERQKEKMESPFVYYDIK